MNAPRRPMMRYHGGKWLLAPWVISHLPHHRVYVEAYGGAASVLMRKPRSDVEILNDLDGRIVNVYRVLQDPSTAAELERRIRTTPFSRAEFNLALQETADPIEEARRTIVRQMMGFGASGPTGFRATAHRNRSQPYSWDWARYPDALRAFVERLRGVTIECEPALELLDRHDQPDVLWYLDPPYVHATRGEIRGDGHNGYLHEMTDEDHVELAERLHRAQAKVVLSGYHSDLYDELYQDWRCIEKAAPIQDNRGASDRVEFLWMNARAVEAAHQRSLFHHHEGG